MSGQIEPIILHKPLPQDQARVAWDNMVNKTPWAQRHVFIKSDIQGTFLRCLNQLKTLPVNREKNASLDRDFWFECTRTLLSVGADPNQFKHRQLSPLVEALLFSPDIVPTLLAYGADPNQPCTRVLPLNIEEQLWPLSVAMTDARTCLKILLQYGANINRQDCSGSTPLMDTVRMNWPELTALLLDFGADPFLTSLSGETVFDIASFFAKNGASECDWILRSHQDRLALGVVKIHQHTATAKTSHDELPRNRKI